MMQAVIAAIATGVPTALVEIRTLGRTLKKRATDILAFFDRPGTSNWPTEAISGRLEHLRGFAVGFRDLKNYIARSLFEAEDSDPNYSLDSEEHETVVGRNTLRPRLGVLEPFCRADLECHRGGCVHLDRPRGSARGRPRRVIAVRHVGPAVGSQHPARVQVPGVVLTSTVEPDT